MLCRLRRHNMNVFIWRANSQRGPIMNFHDQDRQENVILSAAKDLIRRATRSFAALRMTGPVVMVRNHHGGGRDKSAPTGVRINLSMCIVWPLRPGHRFARRLYEQFATSENLR